ncbi:hypothetical protein [Streptomyces sp. JB150]|uniref:hypothetical protein n=1 Tax=Streptomyces sp. JB150 TaxID=2714844 RepID=UPI0014088FD2|nr:hypothetical protein [Streptomyces sp. JB150]QIJ62736.1 hypothetical protein G7Z13_12325 [Streptomyces sp. JB150]
MRGLSVRRIACTALCATVVIGIAGPSALAADQDTARVRAASGTGLPGAEELLARTAALGDLGTVLDPVTDVLTTVLEADAGRLTDAEADKLAVAVKESLAQATALPSATPVPDASPAAPLVPAAPSPAASSSPAVPAAPVSSAPPAALPAPTSLADSEDEAVTTGFLDELLDALQKAVDELLVAATSDETELVVPASDEVLDQLVDALTTTLVDTTPAEPALTDLSAATLSLPVALPPLPTTSLSTTSLSTSLSTSTS